MPLEIILSPRLSGSLCSLCFDVWGRSEPFPFILSPSFLYLLYLLFPQFLSEITGPFFLKRNITSFCQLGGKRGESTEWKTRGEHQTHTHTHTHKEKKTKKKTRTASLKQSCCFEMSQIIFSVLSGHQGVRSVFPCLFPLLTFRTESQRRFKLVHIGHLSSSDSKHLQVFAWRVRETRLLPLKVLHFRPPRFIVIEEFSNSHFAPEGRVCLVAALTCVQHTRTAGRLVKGHSFSTRKRSEQKAWTTLTFCN